MFEERLRCLAGVDRALIFGSWARRYHREPGPLPQDIDLIVIGVADVEALRSGDAAVAMRVRPGQCLDVRSR